MQQPGGAGTGERTSLLPQQQHQYRASLDSGGSSYGAGGGFGGGGASMSKGEAAGLGAAAGAVGGYVLSEAQFNSLMRRVGDAHLINMMLLDGLMVQAE